MRGRLQFILIILLFVTAGMLAAQQSGMQHRAGDGIRTFLTQSAPCSTQAVCCLIHPLYAPELTGGVMSENPSLKAAVRHLSVPAYNLCTSSSALESGIRHLLEGYVRTVDYYVFWLGRIRI